MGVHNRITKQKYNSMKKYLKKPSDDPTVAEKFGVGLTTCRNVRRTKDYNAYLERVFRFHGNPRGHKCSGSKKKARKGEMDAVQIIAIVALTWIVAAILFIIAAVFLQK